MLGFLDRHHAWQSLDPTLDIWSNFMKKKKALTYYFSFVSFLKKMQLFLKRCNFLSSQVIHLGYPRYPLGLSARLICLGYPPRLFARVIWGYSSSYLMLPNLTNHFNKLSNGDLQCE